MKLFKTALFLPLLMFLSRIAHAQTSGPGRMGDGDVMNGSMMDCGMMGGWMMIVPALFGLLILIILVLLIFALIKYLRKSRS